MTVVWGLCHSAGGRTWADGDTGYTERVDVETGSTYKFGVYTSADGSDGLDSDSVTTAGYLTTSTASNSAMTTVLLREVWNAGGTAILRGVGLVVNYSDGASGAAPLATRKYSTSWPVPTVVADTDTNARYLMGEFLNSPVGTGASFGDRGIGLERGANTYTDMAGLLVLFDHMPDDCADITAPVSSCDLLYSTVDDGNGYSDDRAEWRGKPSSLDGVWLANISTNTFVNWVHDCHATSGWSSLASGFPGSTVGNDSTAPAYGKSSTATQYNSAATLEDWDRVSAGASFGDWRQMGSDGSAIVVVKYDLEVTYTVAATPSMPPLSRRSNLKALLVR
jgi:hypothetical protein